ncbi:MAG: cytochrome bc complex cytochrome b subunit [Flaviflexus sp.]|uniref:cytochrome bc1 complex cytochrome b subunit n=1 Tax=Flaviflexus sp. TaxID=1969482 RepID=UPI00352D513F
MTTPKYSQKPKQSGGALNYVDERVGLSGLVKGFARKLFPDHWSFLLGEIALYSFITLILTGIFLAMFFVPSMATTTYPLDALPVTEQGNQVTEAYASTLKISFEVKGGLLIRQMHHWAALLFMASIVAHMFRIFFTGAFRKPRELNWLVGFSLLILGLLAGFTGYSLPDDVLSGNGLRIADGVAKSIPIVGSWASFALFGGEFPGTDIIPRLFTLHILVVPGLILALVGLHLLMVVVHKHTQYPGPGRKEDNVVGFPVFPVYAAKAGGFFFIVFGFIALLGATLSINNVWNYGGYDPSPVSAGAQPDWYMLFMEGALRLMPGWEFEWLGFTFSLNILIPGLVIPGILFGALAMYPFIEAWVTGDKREHHILDRPRNVPVRTAIGYILIVEFFILVLAGSNDIMATHFHLSLNGITWTLRILLLIAPFITFWIVKRVCLSLQRRDRELAMHGRSTGRVVQTADGAFHSVHRPLDEYELWTLVQHDVYRPIEHGSPNDADGHTRSDYKKLKRRSKVSRFFFEDRVEPVTKSELKAAQASHHHLEDGKPSTSVAQLERPTDEIGS